MDWLCLRKHLKRHHWIHANLKQKRHAESSEQNENMPWFYAIHIYFKMFFNFATVQRMKKIVVIGLGNPGKQYELTRHNVGFLVVDLLIDKLGLVEKHFSDRVEAHGKVGMADLILVKPLTYMNLSGKAVNKVMTSQKVVPTDIFVVTDDINLDTGVIRIRTKGSAGGHNGLKSIEQEIGTQDFPRLRLGVGNKFSPGRQADFVLSQFPAAEWPAAEIGIMKSAEAIQFLLANGLEKTMTNYNG